MATISVISRAPRLFLFFFLCLCVCVCVCVCVYLKRGVFRGLRYEIFYDERSTAKVLV